MINTLVLQIVLTEYVTQRVTSVRYKSTLPTSLPSMSLIPYGILQNINCCYLKVYGPITYGFIHRSGVFDIRWRPLFFSLRRATDVAYKSYRRKRSESSVTTIITIHDFSLCFPLNLYKQHLLHVTFHRRNEKNRGLHLISKTPLRWMNP